MMTPDCIFETSRGRGRALFTQGEARFGSASRRFCFLSRRPMAQPKATLWSETEVSANRCLPAPDLTACQSQKAAKAAAAGWPQRAWATALPLVRAPKMLTRMREQCFKDLWAFASAPTGGGLATMREETLLSEEGMSESSHPLPGCLVLGYGPASLRHDRAPCARRRQPCTCQPSDHCNTKTA